jgi:CubicO group peptidase (beta-lactamase class C family)
MKNYNILITLLISLLSQVSLSQGAPKDYWPANEWRKSTPEMQGMDSKAISKTVALAIKKELKIHSLQIIRNGYLVTDIFFYPYDGSTLHDMASTTKSVTSMLTGIAIGQGFLRDENMSLTELFPEFKGFKAEAENLTLASLLSMRSGFGSDEKAAALDFFKEPDVLLMVQNDNWIDHVLGLPITEKPGTKYRYNSCNYHLLSGVLRKSTGMKESDFARQNLFNPLGIKDFIWPSDPVGNTLGWGDLKLHPHDMAKLGYLMLKKGKWDNRQIIPEDWIKKTTGVQVDLPDKKAPFNIDYGFGWYVLSGTLEGFYQATGRGGQYIIVWPEKDIVIVYTGGGFDAGILAKGLLSSIKSDQSLPPDEKGYSKLQKMAEIALREPENDAVKLLTSPPAGITNKSWKLEDNPLKFRTVSIGKIDENLCELSLKSEFFEFERLPVHFDNVKQISYNGKYKLPVYATAKWENLNEMVVNVNEIANVNSYTIRLVFENENLTFGFIEKSMMKKEIVLPGVPADTQSF